MINPTRSIYEFDRSELDGSFMMRWHFREGLFSLRDAVAMDLVYI